MNKYIKRELEKCKIAKIPTFDDNTTHMIIPKEGFLSRTQTSNDLYLGEKYLIQVENYIVHPYSGFTLHENWNNGIVPTDVRMRIKVEQLMGKMVKVSAVGVNDGKSWQGWLPRKSIHILEE